MESPLQSKFSESALALAEEAERQGCRNVVVQVPNGDALSLHQFAREYCGGPTPGHA